jgi:hypothetical protein
MLFKSKKKEHETREYSLIAKKETREERDKREMGNDLLSSS